MHPKNLIKMYERSGSKFKIYENFRGQGTHHEEENQIKSVSRNIIDTESLDKDKHFKNT